jgi:malonyl-CoA O-methyltransferase
MYSPNEGLLIRKGFNRLAARYIQDAVLAKEIEARLISHLDEIRLVPKLIANLGCGGNSRLVGERFPTADILHIDFAREMLMQASTSLPVCADCRALPLPNGSMNMVYSSLLLPWCKDLSALFQETRRITVSDGLFLFSTLGPDSFKELRAVRADLGEKTDFPLPDMHDIGDLLLKCGYTEPVMEAELLTISYPSLPAMLSELKAHGGSVPPHRSRNGLGGKRRMDQLAARYPARTTEGRFTVSLEVLYGHAWAISESTPSRHTGPTGNIPLRHWR